MLREKSLATPFLELCIVPLLGCDILYFIRFVVMDIWVVSDLLLKIKLQ